MAMYPKKILGKPGRPRIEYLSKQAGKASPGHRAKKVSTGLILHAFRKMSRTAKAKLLQQLGADVVVEMAPQTRNVKPRAARAMPVFEVEQHRDYPTYAHTMQRMRFGDATIVAPQLSATKLQENLAHSARVLDAAMRAVQHPGVRISRRKGVPLYYADENYPGKIVRELNGQREVGVVEDSTFVVTG